MSKILVTKKNRNGHCRQRERHKVMGVQKGTKGSDGGEEGLEAHRQEGKEDEMEDSECQDKEC